MTALPRTPGARIAQRGAPTALVVPEPQIVSAVPQTVNLFLYKGDDFWLDLIVTNPDGSDTDLSAATASAQIRTAPNVDDIMASFDASIEANVIHLHLPHAQASDLIAGSCAWDAQISTGVATHTSTWAWTASLIDAAGAGQIGSSGTSWAATTQLNVNLLDSAGLDSGFWFEQIAGGDQLRTELGSDPARYASWTVSADPVDNGGWWIFPVVLNVGAGAVPAAAAATKLTMPGFGRPAPIVTTLAAGPVVVSGEVTMP